MSLPRTRSQVIAAAGTGHTFAITSYDQCQAVLREIAAIDCPEAPERSGIVLAAKDLTASAVAGTVKKHLPTLISLIDNTSEAHTALASVVQKSKAVLAYLNSEAYERELAGRMVAKGLFDAYIDGRIAERLAESGGDGGRRSSGKQRKIRNVVLEDRVHYTVAELVFVKYKKKGFTVRSSLTTWPDPVEGGFANVDDGMGGEREAWRPMWSNFHHPSNNDFIDEVVGKIEGDYENAHSEEEIRSSLEVFFESIERQRREAAKGDEAAVKASRRKNARVRSLTNSLTHSFHKSILEQCRERDLLYSAIRSPSIYTAPLGRNEPHGLPTPALDEGGDLLGGYDGFQLFLERSEEREMPANAAQWVVRDPLWWSELVRLGYWTLYESSQPKEGQTPRTPIFHVPHPYRQVLSIENLPLLASSDMTPAAAKKAERHFVHRGMVSASILDAAPYQEWCADLVDDPASRDDRPSLRELLDRPEHSDLARRVRRHMDLPKEYAEDVYEKMWALKVAGRTGEYVDTLRADDSLAVLHRLNLADLGFEPAA